MIEQQSPTDASTPRPRGTIRVLELAVPALVLVAAAPAAVRYLSRAGFSPAFVLPMTVLLALVGWSAPVRSAVLRTYAAFAVPLSTWLLLSSIASGSQESICTAAATALWFLLLIPGLAKLASDRRADRAIRFGFVVGASVFLLQAAARLAQGQTVFEGGQAVGLGGANRNLVSLVVLVALALYGLDPRRGIIGRLLLVVPGALLIGSGASRSGLAAVLAIPVLWLLLADGRRSIAIRGARVGGVLLLVLTFTAQFGVLPVAGLERLTTTDLSAPTDTGDQVRNALLDKSQDILLSNPVLGIGLGQFSSTPHPAIEAIPVASTRESARRANAHNTYLEVGAAGGFPALLLLTGLHAWLFLALVRRAGQSLDVRTAAVTLMSVCAFITFHSVLGSIVHLTVVLCLAALVRAERGDEVADARAI